MHCSVITNSKIASRRIQRYSLIHLGKGVETNIQHPYKPLIKHAGVCEGVYNEGNEFGSGFALPIMRKTCNQNENYCLQRQQQSVVAGH